LRQSMRHKVEFPLVCGASITRVDEHSVDGVDALEIHVYLRECGDLSIRSSLVNSLWSKVKGVEWNVESLLGHNLIKGSVHLLLKHNHVTVNLKLCYLVVPCQWTRRGDNSSRAR
jgi:hypothetical protein